MNRAVRRAVSRACSAAVRGIWGPATLGLAAAAWLLWVPAASAQYCAAGSNSCSQAALDERITHIVINTLDHTSDPSSSPTGCYTDLTAFSTTLTRGQAYPITVEYVNSFSGDRGSVWIDWDQSQNFSQAGEQVVLTRSTGVFSGTITVPATAVLGNTRMRVRVGYTDAPVACGNNLYGEVQDFTVTVAPATMGACCTPGSAQCTITTPGGCSGGTYQGNASSCDPFNPCGGACCTGGSCGVSLASACPGTSIFIPNGVCTASSCTYCAAGVSFCNSTGNELITRVVFADIDNSTANDPSQPCYTDNTSVVGHVVRGATYTFRFEYANPAAQDQGTVWFDWNRDFAFGDVVSGEQVPLTHPGGDPAQFSATVTVPAGASLGNTRMRVRVQWTGGPLACGNNSYGEVEDYTLNVAVPTNGACCAPSGSCSMTTSTSCPGAFQGLSSSCSPSNPCGGACCSGSGACTVTVASTCPGGSTFLNHRVCGTGTCDGACCDSTGVCTVISTLTECSGGTYQGAGTSCSPSPCPGQSCGSPFPLTLGVPRAGMLSQSVANSAISCSVGVKGLWYSFTASSAGDYAFNSTNTGGTGTPSLALFTACAAEIACTNPFTPSATLVQNMTAGQTIIFREGAANDVDHSYNVTVSVPVYGSCCHPTTGACSPTSIGAAGCPAGTNYAGTGAVCSPNPCGRGSCCHPLGICSLSTASGCPSGNSFTLGTSACSPNPCAIPPITNGVCTSAAALSLNVAYQGNNSQDPGDGTEGPGGSCFYGSPGNFSHGVWFTFTAPATTNYLVSACGTVFDTSLAVFQSTGSPACDNLVEIACNDDDCIGGTSDNPMPGPGPGNIYSSVVGSVPFSAGITYYIRLAAWSTGGTGGAYGVVVQYAQGVTLGSCCIATACTIREPGDCIGTFTTGGGCSPNPCAATGVCCRGATCNAGVTQANCTAPTTHAGAVFVSAAAACNAAGNRTTPCCEANYNKSGGISVQDIFDFLADWFSGSPFTRVGGDGTGAAPGVQSIFDFLGAWFGGGCT